MRHTHTITKRWIPAAAAALILAPALSVGSLAQQPLYDDAPVVIETLSSDQLQNVVGPIALYPDDLLAVVLPASAFPLQIVQASRFLDDFERDDSLQPDPQWDESVVALLNYPEVLRLMSEDLDWTYDLGTAVVSQQADVIDAIDQFRDLAYSSGNLKTDDRQVVAVEEDHITITPVEREVVYVPYYEPERVIVVQRDPVYHYYPRPFPLYYYPYSSFNRFHNPYFWGVSSAYQIGWHNRGLNIHLHNYASHPFFGRSYLNSFYYHHRYQPARLRHRPVSNSRGGYANVRNRNYRGDQWRPMQRRNAQSINQTRQRAARVSRTNVTRTLKPRDPRTRAAVNSSRRSVSTTNSRSIAPKNRAQRTQGASSTSNNRRVVNNGSTRRATTTQRDTRRSSTTSRNNAKPRATYRTAKPATQRNSPRSATTTSRTRTTTTRTTRQSAPRQTTQRQSAPRQSAPRQSAPRQSAPRQSAPRQSAPRQSAPKNAQRQSAPASRSSSSSRSESRSRSNSDNRSRSSSSSRRDRR